MTNVVEMRYLGKSSVSDVENASPFNVFFKCIAIFVFRRKFGVALLEVIVLLYWF